ncbi:hypothetical protein GE09DRAFT_63720 [Coniochaeta sp. 2T2.1]|nr:hypothetical protein GE09DRAFT_63720 [Coniochaeta sp. 2T2.1]
MAPAGGTPAAKTPAKETPVKETPGKTTSAQNASAKKTSAKKLQAVQTPAKTVQTSSIVATSAALKTNQALLAATNPPSASKQTPAVAPKQQPALAPGQTSQSTGKPVPQSHHVLTPYKIGSNHPVRVGHVSDPGHHQQSPAPGVQPHTRPQKPYQPTPFGVRVDYQVPQGHHPYATGQPHGYTLQPGYPSSNPNQQVYQTACGFQYAHTGQPLQYAPNPLTGYSSQYALTGGQVPHRMYAAAQQPQHGHPAVYSYGQPRLPPEQTVYSPELGHTTIYGYHGHELSTHLPHYPQAGGHTPQRPAPGQTWTTPHPSHGVYNPYVLGRVASDPERGRLEIQFGAFEPVQIRASEKVASAVPATHTPRQSAPGLTLTTPHPSRPVYNPYLQEGMVVSHHPTVVPASSMPSHEYAHIVYDGPGAYAVSEGYDVPGPYASSSLQTSQVAHADMMSPASPQQQPQARPQFNSFGGPVADWIQGRGDLPAGRRNTSQDLETPTRPVGNAPRNRKLVPRPQAIAGTSTIATAAKIPVGVGRNIGQIISSTKPSTPQPDDDSPKSPNFYELEPSSLPRWLRNKKFLNPGKLRAPDNSPEHQPQQQAETRRQRTNAAIDHWRVAVLDHRTLFSGIVNLMIAQKVDAEKKTAAAPEPEEEEEADDPEVLSAQEAEVARVIAELRKAWEEMNEATDCRQFKARQGARRAAKHAARRAQLPRPSRRRRARAAAFRAGHSAASGDESGADTCGQSFASNTEHPVHGTEFRTTAPLYFPRTNSPPFPGWVAWDTITERYEYGNESEEEAGDDVDGGIGDEELSFVPAIAKQTVTFLGLDTSPVQNVGEKEENDANKSRSASVSGASSIESGLLTEVQLAARRAERTRRLAAARERATTAVSGPSGQVAGSTEADGASKNVSARDQNTSNSVNTKEESGDSARGTLTDKGKGVAEGKSVKHARALDPRVAVPLLPALPKTSLAKPGQSKQAPSSGSPSKKNDGPRTVQQQRQSVDIENVKPRAQISKPPTFRSPFELVPFTWNPSRAHLPQHDPLYEELNTKTSRIVNPPPGFDGCEPVSIEVTSPYIDFHLAADPYGPQSIMDLPPYEQSRLRQLLTGAELKPRMSSPYEEMTPAQREFHEQSEKWQRVDNFLMQLEATRRRKVEYYPPQDYPEGSVGRSNQQSMTYSDRLQQRCPDYNATIAKPPGQPTGEMKVIVSPDGRIIWQPVLRPFINQSDIDTKARLQQGHMQQYYPASTSRSGYDPNQTPTRTTFNTIPTPSQRHFPLGSSTFPTEQELWNAKCEEELAKQRAWRQAKLNKTFSSASQYSTMTVAEQMEAQNLDRLLASYCSGLGISRQEFNREYNLYNGPWECSYVPAQGPQTMEELRRMRPGQVAEPFVNGMYRSLSLSKHEESLPNDWKRFPRQGRREERKAHPETSPFGAVGDGRTKPAETAGEGKGEYGEGSSKVKTTYGGDGGGRDSSAEMAAIQQELKRKRKQMGYAT